MRSTPAKRWALPLSFLLFSQAAAAQVLAVDWDGLAYTVDEDTGEITFLASTGLININSLARDAGGRLVGAGHVPSNVLFEIDPLTGGASVFHYAFLNSIRGLAFSPTDTLYAVDAPSPVVRDLYVLDLSAPVGSTSIKQFIGRCNVQSIQGLTFRDDGTLYAWDGAFGLMVVDPATARCSDVNDRVDGHTFIQSLFFDRSGRLFGIGDDFYTLDLQSGAAHLLANLALPGQSLRGAEFSAALLPQLAVEDEVFAGQTGRLDLDLLPQASFLVALAPGSGPLTVPGVPFALDLGPDLASISVLTAGLGPSSGEYEATLQVPDDPGLIGQTIYWQAYSSEPRFGLRKSNQQATVIR